MRKKAFTPVVNIVGEHATYHIEHNAPLTADIEGIANPVSGWVKTSRSAKTVAADGAEAVAASMGVPGQVATLILPANTAWEESDGPAVPVAPDPRPKASAELIHAAVAALTSGEECMIHISDTALMGEALEMAGRIIAAKTGCRLTCKTSNRRWERGIDRVPVERIEYPVDSALKQLETVQNLILLGAPIPVAFFAYPNKPSVLIPESCNVVDVAPEGYDLLDALTAIAEELDAVDVEPVRQKAEKPTLIKGELTPESIAAAIGRLMPKNAIIVDESITSGRGLMSSPPVRSSMTGCR